ncbi:uncharacterized protein VTP21DRAFT_8616 [Calcarisporiella thermophila]|uniref:uncharacterized protein n=1 Tax=Calcarisporiella thermophila TaxID=911321 RepID=UPI003742ECFD
MVMVESRKSRAEMDDDLREVIGEDYDPSFTEWLFKTIESFGRENASRAETMMDTENDDGRGGSDIDETSWRRERSPRRGDVSPRREYDRDRERSPRRGMNGYSRRYDTYEKRRGMPFGMPVFPDMMYNNNSDAYTDASSIVLTSSRQQCAHWPNCWQGAGCKFAHPTELCPAWPNCGNSPTTCDKIHPDDPRPEVQELVKEWGEDPEGEERGGGGIAKRVGMGRGRGRWRDSNTDLREEREENSWDGGAEESVIDQSSKPSAPMPKCKFFPNCTNATCPFLHEVEKVLRACRFGQQCTRPGCHFIHPWDSEWSSVSAMAETPCKFGLICARPNCPFKHPSKPFKNLTLVVNRDQSQSDQVVERSFAVGEEEVEERMHVEGTPNWKNGSVSHSEPEKVKMD